MQWAGQEEVGCLRGIMGQDDTGLSGEGRFGKASRSTDGLNEKKSNATVLFPYAI
jgi:hypothetical protein